MLHVFVKFGRPVEEDAMHLFRKKLEAQYQNANDPSTRRTKRLQAIDEIIDHRIESILRTMTSYTTNNKNPTSYTGDNRLSHTLTESQVKDFLTNEVSLASTDNNNSNPQLLLQSSNTLLQKAAADYRESFINKNSSI